MWHLEGIGKIFWRTTCFTGSAVNEDIVDTFAIALIVFSLAQI